MVVGTISERGFGFSIPIRAPACSICFIYYLAAACWNAAAAAVAFIFLAIITRIEPNMKDVEANLYVLVWGILFNTILGLVAISTALRYKIRVWVHPRLRSQVQGDLRLAANLKPLRCGFNYAIFVTATALVFLAVIVGVIFFAVQTIDQKVNAPVTTFHLLYMFSVLFGCPLAMIPCYAWLSSRIIARSPRECWPEGSVTDEFIAFRQGIDL